MPDVEGPSPLIRPAAIPLRDGGRLEVTRIGIGTASIGGLYAPVAEADAVRLLEHAWERGCRFFDTAPYYGYGLAERRLGAVLAARPRSEYVISTKVGRLLRPVEQVGPDADLFDGREQVGALFDFSADGVARSIDESCVRLGVDRLDVAFLHDPDDHWPAAINEAIPALAALRAAGRVRAIGAGMNQAAMLTRFVLESDIDVVLCAGRYTLLDQTALETLLPACVERRVGVVVGGVMNSGLLADPRPGAHFDYVEAPPDLVARAMRIQAICAGFGVALKAAAIQFPLAHPAVAGVLAGVRDPAHLDDYYTALATPIPAALWDALRSAGLIRPEAPCPVGG